MNLLLSMLSGMGPAGRTDAIEGCHRLYASVGDGPATEQAYAYGAEPQHPSVGNTTKYMPYRDTEERLSGKAPYAGYGVSYNVVLQRDAAGLSGVSIVAVAAPSAVFALCAFSACPVCAGGVHASPDCGTCSCCVCAWC